MVMLLEVIALTTTGTLLFQVQEQLLPLNINSNQLGNASGGLITYTVANTST
jgi:hypothetical protein